MNRIKELRIAAGMKQADLAEKISTTYTTVSKYELGQRDLGVDTITTLCRIFDCSSDYLLGLSDLKNQDLSPFETALLLAYRKSDDHTKDLVRLALEPYWEEKQSVAAI